VFVEGCEYRRGYSPILPSPMNPHVACSLPLVAKLLREALEAVLVEPLQWRHSRKDKRGTLIGAFIINTRR